jgi:hypothetical protein
LIPLLSTPKIIQIPCSWARTHHTWVECGRRLWTNNKKSTSQKSGSCSHTQIYIIKIYSKCQGGSWMLEMMVLKATETTRTCYFSFILNNNFKAFFLQRNTDEYGHKKSTSSWEL